MMKFFRRRHTVATLTGNLTKTVDALKALEKAETDRAYALADQADALLGASREANEHARRAASVSAKLGALLN